MLERMANGRVHISAAVIDQRLSWSSSDELAPGDPSVAGQRLVDYSRAIGLSDLPIVLYSAFTVQDQRHDPWTDTAGKAYGNEHVEIVLKVRGLLRAQGVHLPPLLSATDRIALQSPPVRWLLFAAGIIGAIAGLWSIFSSLL